MARRNQPATDETRIKRDPFRWEEDEARQASLQAFLRAQWHPVWGPEDLVAATREFRVQARSRSQV